MREIGRETYAASIETGVRRAREAEWVGNQLPATLPGRFLLMARIALDQYICDLGERDKNAEADRLPPLAMLAACRT